MEQFDTLPLQYLQAFMNTKFLNYQRFRMVILGLQFLSGGLTSVQNCPC